MESMFSTNSDEIRAQKIVESMFPTKFVVPTSLENASLMISSIAFTSKSIDEDGGMWGNGKSSFLQEPHPNPFDEAFTEIAIRGKLSSRQRNFLESIFGQP